MAIATGISVLVDRLRSSLWFIPTVMTTIAASLAIFTVEFEQRHHSPLDDVLGFIYSGGPDGAREILATIAGSMITIAGVSFSIVIVALSLASTQFGHRLLRNFMRDRTNQIVLGTFISTFVYCLLTLRSIRSLDEVEFIPDLSVTLGLGFALASLAVLIYFIHHVSRSIQADHVVAVVAADLEDCVERLFPAHVGNERASQGGAPGGPLDGWELRPRKSGYLQAIATSKLTQLAEKHDLIITLGVRPGAFMTEAIGYATVSPKPSWSRALEDSIADCFTIGRSRTPYQDIEFAIEQLVEIAVRALSPGINAPFTAAACLDRLPQALSPLLEREMPAPLRFSDEGNLRIIAPTVDFRTLCDQAFDPIRHYGRSSPIVLFRMMDVLKILIARCPRADRRSVLIDHAAETRRAGELHIASRSVLRTLTEKYQRTINDGCDPSRTLA